MVYNKLGGKMNRPEIFNEDGAHRYYTPEQYEAETGEKMLETDRVWVWTNNNKTYHKKWVPMSFDQFLSSYFDQPCVIAQTGQPKPPEEWRPE